MRRSGLISPAASSPAKAPPQLVDSGL